MQCVDLRASVGIRVAMQIGAALGVGLSVAVGPGVAAALGDGEDCTLRVVDGQVQGDDTVAAGMGPAVDSVGRGTGAGGVGVPVPGVAAASGNSLHTLRGDAVAHGDGDAGGLAGAPVGKAGHGVGGGGGGCHGDGTVVCARGPYIAAGAARGERGALVAVDISVAGNGHDRDGLDGEVQGDDTVAAGGGPVGDSVSRGAGTGSVSGPVPGVATTGSDGLHPLRGDAVAYGDSDTSGRAGTTVGGADDGVGGGAGG